jgi:glutathione S-transferase
MDLELIGFPLCPFVQRAVIVLKEKRVDYRLTLIDPDDPPEWLDAVSPLGRVPLLRMDGANLIESQVICEFLDETCAPRLHPADPVARAGDRGWIEVVSELLRYLQELVSTPREGAYRQARAGLAEGLEGLALEATATPYWHGRSFSLVDAAFAPLYLRLRLLAGARPELQALLGSGLSAWGEALGARPSVCDSLLPDFDRRYRRHFAERGSFALAPGAPPLA